MPAHRPAETIQTHGCSIVLRRIAGPEADELFLHTSPPAEARTAEAQADALQRALLGVLEAEGGSAGSVVWQTIFFRDLERDLDATRAARARILPDCAGPPTIETQQPPLVEGALLEVSVHAVLPRGKPLATSLVEAAPTCACAECARGHARLVQVGEETRFHATGLYGAGADAFEQTIALFEAAEGLLQRAGMAFGDVARTWIHLRHMDRDYADLNRARRAFFEARGIDPAPASTGIGGDPAAAAHDLSLAVYATKAPRPPERSPMTAPTLNEAPEYGSDFARGLKLVEANKTALYLSGTASIDEAGRTAHPGDVEAQVDRMLVNVAALLEGEGASFRDVVSAITYLKRPEDAERLRARLRAGGFEGFPNALVVAPICRPELLCETEAVAVLPD